MYLEQSGSVYQRGTRPGEEQRGDMMVCIKEGHALEMDRGMKWRCVPKRDTPWRGTEGHMCESAHGRYSPGISLKGFKR